MVLLNDVKDYEFEVTDKFLKIDTDKVSRWFNINTVSEIYYSKDERKLHVHFIGDDE